jgi:hypothetical protein
MIAVQADEKGNSEDHDRLTGISFQELEKSGKFFLKKRSMLFSKILPVSLFDQD